MVELWGTASYYRITATFKTSHQAPLVFSVLRTSVSSKLHTATTQCPAPLSSALKTSHNLFLGNCIIHSMTRAILFFDCFAGLCRMDSGDQSVCHFQTYIFCPQLISLIFQYRVHISTECSQFVYSVKSGLWTMRLSAHWPRCDSAYIQD